jgi:hypothetical protein
MWADQLRPTRLCTSLRQRSGTSQTCLHVGVVHNLNHALGRQVIFNAHGIVGVIVHVDHVKLGTVDDVGSRVHHRLRMKIFEQKGFVLLGIRGRLVANLLLRLALRSRLGLRR